MTTHSILVVDDDPGVLEAIRQSLEPSGYAVFVAADGKEAIRFLSRETVDLVITDVLMPDMDGFELIKVLHRDYPAVRVVAMTGGGQLSADTYLRMAQGFRVDWLLKKPFARDELLMAIKAVEIRSSIPAPPCAA
jgi:DNA-binding response OmpR family regulator